MVAISSKETKCYEDKLCGDCDQNECKVCYNSYVQDDGTCKKPSDEIDNCLEYKDKDTCVKCKHGLKPTKDDSDESNSCEEISVENCDVLASDTEKCEICSKGILVSADGKCVKNNKCRKKNCDYCTLNGTIETCERCVTGYAINS